MSPPVDQAIAEIAERQHGVATAAQLMAAGLGRNGITTRVRRGALHRVHRAVYAIGHPVLPREGEFLAAVLAAGLGAGLAGDAAAELWRVRRARAQVIDVVAPRPRSVPGVRVRSARGLGPLDLVVYRGVPVTNIARLLVDLTETLTPEELVNVISEAAFRNRFNLVATKRAIARANGRRHLDVLEEALRLYETGSAGTRSAPEVAGVKALKSSDLPNPVVNTKLMDIEVDFQWPEYKVAVEIDGPGHDRPPNRRADARRDAALRAAGWTVLRFSADDVERHPERILDALREHLPCQSS